MSGDPTLQNEIADSRTFGFVLRPLPQMVLTIDYVSIDIENVITTVNASDVLEACYDNPAYPSADCSRITRDPTGQVTLVKTGFANEGYQKLNGVQTEWDYSFDLPSFASAGSLGTMDFRLNDYWENHNTKSLDTTNVISSSGIIGNSKHRGTLDVTWSKNMVFADWQSKYVGRAKFDNALPTDYTAVQGVGTWWVNNLTVGVVPVPNMRIQLVVDNIFDKQPPYPLPATPLTSNGSSGTSTYFSGIMGRYFVLSFNYKIL